MNTKKVNKNGIKRKKKITIEVKKEIIEKYEQGMRITDIARLYEKSTSTICTILKKKEEIKDLQTAKGVTRVSKQRPPILEVIEKLLLVWINERQVAGEAVTESLVCEKAKSLYGDMLDKLPGTSSQNVEAFKASRGWFDKFKRRSGIRCVRRQGETGNLDAMTPEIFRKLIINESYLPQQVFNCVETEFFWKKLPKRIYIAEEENATLGHKSMKDRFSLLLCANATGDFKVKPLLVYHSENPRAFKQCKMKKIQLSVMWRTNKTAITNTLFVEWVNEVFGPSVKKYLLENKFPLKVLLVLDNSLSCPPDLHNELPEELHFIKVIFLPPGTAAFLGPFNQEVISNLKQLYTKSLFQQCFKVMKSSDITLRQFWKNHFHIINCVKLITKAWNDVTKRTINHSWRKLWPECVEESTLDQEPSIIKEIISLGESMGLEVKEKDIKEFLDEHAELTTEELMNLHEEEHEKKMEQKYETQNYLQTNEIREMCNMWDKLQNFIEKHHPNKTEALHAVNSFDEAMSHFRKILKQRQKPLERFRVKTTINNSVTS